MNGIDKDAIADIHFEMSWESAEATHSEHYEAYNINFWRDCMPEDLLARLNGKAAGDVIEIDFEPGIVVSGNNIRNTFDVKICRPTQ